MQERKLCVLVLAAAFLLAGTGAAKATPITMIDSVTGLDVVKFNAASAYDKDNPSEDDLFGQGWDGNVSRLQTGTFNYIKYGSDSVSWNHLFDNPTAVLTPVSSPAPEPSTILLLGSGIGGLFTLGSLKRKKQLNLKRQPFNI